MKYYAIIVEGRTDSALIEAMLEKEFGFKAYTNKKDLPDIFVQMMGKYPQQTGVKTYWFSIILSYRKNRNNYSNSKWQY